VRLPSLGAAGVYVVSAAYMMYVGFWGKWQLLIGVGGAAVVGLVAWFVTKPKLQPVKPAEVGDA
jgi:hypothetical protein